MTDTSEVERGVLPEHIPLQEGESRGADLAKRISEIALRVRGDVERPQGRE